MGKIKHICFTCFIVPIEAHLFTRPATHEEKCEWLKESFLKNQDFETNIGQEFAVRILQEENNLVFGKLSKKMKYHIHEKTQNDIKDKNIEDWPYLGFVFDLSENIQKLVIEYESTVIRKIGPFSKTLEELVNQKMFTYGYAVSFDPLVDDSNFWGIIEKAEGVYSLGFELSSPNLFGANSAANESLKEIREIFNNTKLDVTLENEKGKLILPKDRIDTFRDYADKGGGNWKVVIQEKSSKKTINSSERAIKISIEADERANPKTLKEVLKQFLNKL